MEPQKNNATLVLGVIVGAVILAGAIFAFGFANTGPGKLDSFATCLKDKGAVFYGAFWCPHCQNQKAMFGKSAELLPYIECSTPDGAGQLPVCTEKKIEGYPTWVFPDGSRLSGEVPLATLSAKTSCPLPDGTIGASIPTTSAASPAK